MKESTREAIREFGFRQKLKKIISEWKRRKVVRSALKEMEKGYVEAFLKHQVVPVSPAQLDAYNNVISGKKTGVAGTISKIMYWPDADATFDLEYVDEQGNTYILKDCQMTGRIDTPSMGCKTEQLVCNMCTCSWPCREPEHIGYRKLIS